MAIQPGQKLLHYELAEKIGEGGMGVVWRGRDTKLDRDVAIKTLPDGVARDPERLARFEREAKLLASLNHGNIATIHGLEHDSGLHFLAMELVEGEDLAARIGRGAIPVEEALPLALQIANALEAAHERGVIHRDLKPPNIKVTPEGNVKVLDFGLAKAFGPDTSDPMTSPTMSPTVTSAGETAIGVILGTAAYMSPEQAKGKPVDRRADIWSFGVVLLEMLTGRLLFRGESVPETIAAVLRAEPDLSGLPANTPPKVRRLIERCLRKDPQSRLRDIGDARVVVEEAIAGREWEHVPSSQGTTAGRRVVLPWILVAVLAGLSAVLGVAIWSEAVTPPAATDGRVVRFSVDLPTEFDTWNFSISPRGDLLAYVGRPRDHADPNEPEPRRLYVRPLDRLESRVVEGSDSLTNYTFSQDGSQIAFRAPASRGSTRYRLFRAPLDGSAPPLSILDWSDDWRSSFLWLPDGDLIAQSSSFDAIVRIPLDGSPPRDPVEIKTEFEGIFDLEGNTGVILPDGVHILGRTPSWEAGKYDDHVAILNVDTGEARVLIRGGATPRWSSTGRLVFARGDALLAVPLDLRTMTTSGEIEAIADGFRAQAIYGDTWFDLSGDGTLVHLPGGVYGDRRRLVIASLEESREPWSDERRYFQEALVVSPGLKRLAVTIVNDAGIYDVWISDFRTPRLRRLISDPGKDCTPSLWTPDGRQLIYTCGTAKETALHIIDVVGDGEVRELLRWSWSIGGYGARTFLPDGRLVLRHSADGESHLKLLALDEPGFTPTMFIENANRADVSPDGRWIAYDSAKSGRPTVYVRPLSNDGSVGREIQVMQGSFNDTWHLLDGNRQVLRINTNTGAYDVSVGGSGQIGEPVQILTAKEREEFVSRLRNLYSLSNGTYMAIEEHEDEKRPDRINVVLNWHTELTRR